VRYVRASPREHVICSVVLTRRALRSEKLLANSPLTLPQATTGNGGASDAPKISWKALAYRLRYVQEQYTEVCVRAVASRL